MSSQTVRLLILSLLLIFFAQLLSAATTLSATVDEGFHITSGYEYLRTGRVQLFDEHPPLAKALFAWPLLLVPDLTPPETVAGYADGDLIAVAQATVLSYTPIDRVIGACRIPVALLSVLLATSLYRLTRKTSGVKGAILALTLFTFDPNILAHSSLATTDLGTTAFSFWTLAALYAYLRAPNHRRWWAVAVLLGFAQLTKLTALLLFPLCGILIIAHAWLHAPNHRQRALLRAVISCVGMGAVAALIVWLAYGLEVRPVATIANGTLPLPAASHIERWERLRANLEYGRESFLLGQNRMHGWWQYFPIAFLVKTPLPVLILAVWTVLHLALRLSVLARQHRQKSGHLNILRFTFYVLRQSSPMLPLLLFPLLYAASSLTSTINIGYRHLLPILPFLYVGIGWVGNWKRVKSKEKRVRSNQNPSLLITHYALRFTFYVLLAWLVVGTLTLAPHYLTFFNELAGGAKNGWRFLADSNTDWGQTLKALAAYQRENQTGPVYLSQFTFLDPAIYGVDYTPIAPMAGAETVLPRRFNPAPGLYAISATTLDGVPLVDPEMYDWFRWRTPDAQIANTLHYYRVTVNETTVTWIAQCNTPVTPLNNVAITEGFGVTGTRHLDFDCTQSWVIPSNDTGRYILHGALLHDTLKARLHEAAPPTEDPFIARRLHTLNIVYRQRTYRTEPAFAIYAPSRSATIPTSSAWIARAETSPALVMTQLSVDGPIPFNGPLAFLGTAVYRQPGALNVETWWIVTGAAPTYPLSIMGHLLTESGEIKGIADGLGIPPQTWQAGDIIIQRHIFPLTSEERCSHYVLRTGVYRLEDGVRWSIASTVNADAIFVLLHY